MNAEALELDFIPCDLCQQAQCDLHQDTPAVRMEIKVNGTVIFVCGACTK